MHWIKDFGAENWTAFFTCAGTFVLIVATWAGIRTIKPLVRTQELEAASRFFEEMERTAADRHFIFQEIDLLADDLNMSSEQDARVQNVINFLNRTAFLSDVKLLPQKFIFSIAHTVIIRCCFVLRGYSKLHEKRIGGRYGRRLIHFEEQAKRYHDASPKHRVTELKVWKRGTNNGMVIHRTEVRDGWAGFWQRWRWRFMRLRHRY